jgi:hypothetical protein
MIMYDNVTCIPIARKRLGKYIPAGVNAQAWPYKLESLNIGAAQTLPVTYCHANKVDCLTELWVDRSTDSHAFLQILEW